MAAGVGVLVTHPGATQGIHGVQRSHATGTDGDVTRGNIRTLGGVVRTQTRTTGGIGFVQQRTTAAGGGGLHHGDLSGDPCGQGLSDGDQVLS